jgi:hypothetical protein
MQSSRFSYHACAIFLAFVLLGGCGRSEPAISATNMIPSTSALATHIDSGESWMLPEARSEDLIYASAYTQNDVYVYDYKTGKQVGLLTGFDVPNGQCVDKKGDVWIANTDGSSVIEYAHGGSAPIATLAADGAPFGCAIDPTTGNLAITTWTYGYGASSLLVWKDARRDPRSYSSYGCPEMWPPGYDSHGNLYIECQNGPPPGYVWELPHGGSKLKKLSVDRLIGAAGSVTWDGRYIALTVQPYSEQNATQIYQVAEKSPGHLTVVHRTYLKDTCWQHSDFVGLVQPFIVGKKNTPSNRTQGEVVLGGNRPCKNRFDFWKYPSGGDPTSELKSAPTTTTGQSVSFAVH